MTSPQQRAPCLFDWFGWRQAAGIIKAESIAVGVHNWAPDFQVLSAADIDIDSRDGAQAVGSSVSAAWAPVIEFIVCQAATATTGLPPIDLHSFLSRPLAPATIDSRLALHLPQDV